MTSSTNVIQPDGAKAQSEPPKLGLSVNVCAPVPCTDAVWSLGRRKNWDKLKQLIEDAHLELFFVASDSDREHLAMMCRALEAKDEEKGTNLVESLITSSAGHEDEAKELLKRLFSIGVDPEVEGVARARASHTVGGMGLVEVAEMLAMCRVDPTARDSSGCSPVVVAQFRSSFLDLEEVSSSI